MITETQPKTATIATVDSGAGQSNLERLYAAHAPRAIRTTYLLTGDEELAYDLVQDAFVKLAGRFRDLRNPDAFAAYLRQTILNLARNHWRRAEVERRYLRREEGRVWHSNDMPDVETRSEVQDALAKLAHRHRVALVLRYFEDLSEQQVAEPQRLFGTGEQGLRAFSAATTMRPGEVVAYDAGGHVVERRPIRSRD